MRFPIARYPGTIALMDDSKELHESMSLQLPESLNLKSFAELQHFQGYMHEKIELIKAMEVFFKGSVDRFHKTGNVAVEVLRFWNSFPERYSIPESIVVDYYMPTKNGIEVLQTTAPWQGGRILLTGMSEEKIVMKAFNEEQIDRFIAKQSPKLGALIGKALEELSDRFANKQSFGWNAWFHSLGHSELLLLESEELISHLKAFVKGGYEYVVIGKPFGVLALGPQGDLKWLQIVRSSELMEESAAAGKASLSGTVCGDIAAGKVLSNARIMAALGPHSSVSVEPVMARITSPFDYDEIYLSSFELKVGGAPSPNQCYAGWFARQPGRD